MSFDWMTGAATSTDAVPGGRARRRQRLTGDPIVREALTTWLLSRVSILVIAVGSGWMFASSQEITPFLARWERWDFDHYEGIAAFGYGTRPTGVPNEAFFPAFPALLRLGEYVGLPYVVTGLLVSLAGGAFSAVALGRLGAMEGSGRIGTTAVLFWVAAPTAVFLAAPYTEALFVAFAFPAWVAAREHRWAAAGVLTALSCLVRVSGVFLAAALVVHWLTTREGRRWRDAGWLLLPAVTLGIWMLYLYRLTGDWLAWLHAQSEGWNREFTMPWTTFANTWDAAFGGTQRVEFAWMFRAEIVAMVIGVVVTVVLLRKHRWGEATWVGLQIVAFGTSFWYFSVPRAVLLWWPLFVMLSVWAQRRRAISWVYFAVSVPLAVMWAVAFLTGRWAG
jgi:hypothetical protein